MFVAIEGILDCYVINGLEPIRVLHSRIWAVVTETMKAWELPNANLIM